MMQEFKSGSSFSEHVLQRLVDDTKSGTEAGRRGRRKVMFRAIYGEFVGTTLFFIPIFGTFANSVALGWSQSFTNMCVALISGLHVTAAIMCFSGISGAQFNPAISFSLWITKKLSNRKFIFYIIAQMAASVLAMFAVYCSFSHPPKEMYEACSLKPAPDAEIIKVFMTEFISTFILAYVAFTSAFEEAEQQKKATMNVKTLHDSDGLTLYSSTPQSNTGFAPFAIGFTVFSMSLYGGSSGIAMNPVRMFGPAIFSGIWDWFWVYWLAEFAGAAAAGLIVVHGIQGISKEDILTNAHRHTVSSSNSPLKLTSNGIQNNGSPLPSISEGNNGLTSPYRNPLQMNSDSSTLDEVELK